MLILPMSNFLMEKSAVQRGFNIDQGTLGVNVTCLSPSSSEQGKGLISNATGEEGASESSKESTVSAELITHPAWPKWMMCVLSSRHSPRNTDAAPWDESKRVISQSFCLLVKGRKKNVLYYQFQIVLQLNYLRGGEVILENTRSPVFLAP